MGVGNCQLPFTRFGKFCNLLVRAVLMPTGGKNPTEEGYLRISFTMTGCIEEAAGRDEPGPL